MSMFSSCVNALLQLKRERLVALFSVICLDLSITCKETKFNGY